MAHPTNTERSDQPHLLSLVSQSQKALLHGGQLCSSADAITKASAECAVDVLALDAKVRWLSSSVAEQLKLAVIVAKSIEERRAQLRRTISEWDLSRARHADNLERVLEALGNQYVPPEFHQTASDSSLFGSQHSNDNGRGMNGHSPSTSPQSAQSAQYSPSATIRDTPNGTGRIRNDRRHWKTLRDFVDDSSIEDALETIDNDRAVLDDTLAKTEHHADTLFKSIATIEEALPSHESTIVIQPEISGQDRLKHDMANCIEELASHYDEMNKVLQRADAGEVFAEDEVEAMQRDASELNKIMGELEGHLSSIQNHHDRLVQARERLLYDRDTMASTLDDLDELGDIMTEMLEEQQVTESDVDAQLTGLEQHLTTLDTLQNHYKSYRQSFNKLILEIARRKQYSEAASNIVDGMMAQLRSMTEEEAQMRTLFNEEHGPNLPEDICLCISNRPTRWATLPFPEDGVEYFPEIPEDLISEAMSRVRLRDSETRGSLPSKA